MKNEYICAGCLFFIIGGILLLTTRHQDICTAPDGSECPATADNTCAAPCTSTFHVSSQQIAAFVLFGIALLLFVGRFVGPKFHEFIIKIKARRAGKK